MRVRSKLGSVVLITLAAAVIAPAAAVGSVRIGSDLANAPDSNGTCSPANCVVVTTRSPSLLKSPTNGVITSWATLGGSSTIGTHGSLRLRVLREAAGGAYTAVRSGPPTSVPTSIGHPLITIPVSPGLPISQGDLVGVENLTTGTAMAQYTSSAFAYAFWGSPLADGTTRAPDSSGLPREVLTQETIEPTNTFDVSGVARHKKKGTATVKLILPNPGDLTTSGKGAAVAGAVTKQVGEGAAKLLVKARGKKRSVLDRTGKVKLSVAITYTPTGGAAHTQPVKVKLRKS